MNGPTVTIRYARALYEVAVEKGVLDRVVEDLSQLDRIINQTPPIRAYCLKRHKDRILEMNFVEIAFIPYVSDLTAAVLKTAVRNGRLSALVYLPAALNQLRAEKAGITDITLETTRPADQTLQEAFSARMSSRLGGKIKLTTRVVPGLLGGVRILWNNRMIDLSASGRLKQIRSKIKAV